MSIDRYFDAIGIGHNGGPALDNEPVARRLLRRKDLRRYQVVFLNKIKNLDHLILALDMGSGKTGTTLTAILDLLDDKDVSRVLIVAPLFVATATWPDEIEAWEHTRLLKWTLIRAEDDDADIVKMRKRAYSDAREIVGLAAKDAQRYSGKAATEAKEQKRARLANTNTELHIINKEALPWLWEHFENGKRWPYDMLVVDEASMFKNAKMRTPLKRPTRFGVMVKARKYATRTVQLTGTPAPKGLQNLWGMARIADLGERLCASKDRFERKWFTKDHLGFNLIPRPEAHDDIMDRMSDIMFSMGPEHYPELPPVSRIPVKVTLPPRVLEEYETFRESMVSQEYNVEAVNRGVLHGKLLQFANGSMYQEDGRDVWIHDEKLGALETLVDELNGEPLLVAYSFKFDLARIKKRYPKLTIFGQGDVRRQKAMWNAGDIELMVAHPDSIGHGQNIQYGGRHYVWYGLTSDLEQYQQFNKRLYRPGQDKPVFGHHIIAKGTYDEKLLPILAARNTTQARIIDSVRLHIRS